MKCIRCGTCFFVTVGLLIAFSFGQDRIIFEDGDSNENGFAARHNSYVFGQSLQIPESILIQMKDIKNISELLNRFVRDPIYDSPTPSGAGSGPHSNISGPHSSSGGPISSRRNPLAGIPIIAKPANCQPELHVVELDKPGHGLQFLWPPCVRVRRCGGCCVSKALSCIPVATSIINITVLQMLYNPLMPDTFINQGARNFPMEQHDRCICDCKIKAEHCNPLQEYRPNECRCMCANQELASQCTDRRKIWDSEDCMCKCKRIYDCSTGSVFNFTKCRCESTRRSRAGNLDHMNTTSTTTEAISLASDVQ